MGSIGGLVCAGSRHRSGPGSGTIPTSSPRTCSSINASAKYEIDIVGDEPIVVMVPAHYRDLLKVMRRAYRGAAGTQVATEGSATRAANPRSTTPPTSRDVLRLCRSHSGSVDAASHSFVAISARACIALGRSACCERDETSRAVTAIPRDAGTAS